MPLAFLACSAGPAKAPAAVAPESAPTPPATAPAAAAAERAEPLPTPAASAPAPPPAAPVVAADLPVGTKVLHVGDSFAAALGIDLGKQLKAVGVRSSLEYKTASYVPTWAFGPELAKLVELYNPDLVLVTLGANELEIPQPEQRVGAIKRLVKKLGDRPCVWILPPLWKADTGLMQVIKDNAAPCKVLDSTRLVADLPRGPDKIHPNTEGRKIWAEAVFRWLQRSRSTQGPKPWTLNDTAP